MNKKELLTLLFIIPLLLHSCNNRPEQPQIYGEKPLYLEWLSFDMDMKKFFPDENKVKRGDVTHEFKLGDDAKGDHTNIYPDDAEIARKLITLTDASHVLPEIYHYSMYGRWNYYKLAAFGNFFFNELNMSTTMDDRLVLVHISKGDLDEDMPLVLLKELKSVYGEPQRQKAIHDRTIECEMYTWETDDRIIVYYWMPHDSPKENSQEVQMYILKKEYADVLVQRIPLSRHKEDISYEPLFHIQLPEMEEIEEEEEKYKYIYAYDNPNVIWVWAGPDTKPNRTYLEFESIPEEEFTSYDTSYSKLSRLLTQETDSMFCIRIRDEDWCFEKETNFDYGEGRAGYKWSEYDGYYSDLNLHCVRSCAVSGDLHGFSSLFLIHPETAIIYHIVEYGDWSGKTPVLSPGNKYMAIINDVYEDGYVQNIEIIAINPIDNPEEEEWITYFSETNTLDVEFTDLIWLNDNEFIVKAYETGWKPEGEPRNYTCYKVMVGDPAK